LKHLSSFNENAQSRYFSEENIMVLLKHKVLLL
jgi:hypothetical protein